MKKVFALLFAITMSFSCFALNFNPLVWAKQTLYSHAHEGDMHYHPKIIKFRNNILEFINDADSLSKEELQTILRILETIEIAINGVIIKPGEEKYIPVTEANYVVIISSKKILNYYLEQFPEIEVSRLYKLFSKILKGQCIFSYNLYPGEEEDRFVELTTPLLDAYDQLPNIYQKTEPSRFKMIPGWFTLKMIVQKPLNDD